MGQVDPGYRIFRNLSFCYNCFLTAKVLSYHYQEKPITTGDI